MKNRILLTIVAVLFTMSAMLLNSCTKEEPINNNLSQRSESAEAIAADDIPDISFNEIDAMALEAANFHTYATERFLAERYNGPGEINEGYYNEMFEYTNNLAREYRFERIGMPEGVEPMPYGDFNRLVELMHGESVGNAMMQMAERLEFPESDIRLAANACDEITRFAESLVFSVNTFDEFRSAYYERVSGILMPFRVRHHFHVYVIVKFYVEIYIRSFHTWCHHFVYPKWGPDPYKFWIGVRGWFPRGKIVIRTDAFAFPIGYIWHRHCHNPWSCKLHRGVVWCVVKSIVISRIIRF